MLDLIMRALSHLLVPLFLLGMAGSAIVVLITLATDFTDFLSDGGNEESPHDSLS